MSNIDFISEKWRTIRRTRRLASIHIISSIVPLIYDAVLLRTVMGKVQVDAFSAWCKHSVEHIRALRGADEESDEQAVMIILKM